MSLWRRVTVRGVDVGFIWRLAAAVFVWRLAVVFVWRLAVVFLWRRAVAVFVWRRKNVRFAWRCVGVPAGPGTGRAPSA